MGCSSPAVLLGLMEERDEHLVIRHRFVDDLLAEDLVGLDVDQSMDFEPSRPDSLLLPNLLAPVSDLDLGAVDGDNDITRARSSGATGNERSRRWIRRCKRRDTFSQK